MNSVKFIFFILIVLLETDLFAQQRFSCVIKDAETLKTLSGVSVLIKNTQRGGTTDSAGKIILRNISSGKQTFLFSRVGYKEQSLNLIFPLSNVDSDFIILLESFEKENEAVIVSSSRTESRIENLPTKVEVLGSEEVNEEVGIKPGNIASLLGDVAGIQIQQTSATTGNMEMRIQGLPGKYTQILKDGMPLFGGYSGSFSILQIPPLDLRQIEIVKGASSTLYGGGAIAGMVNLISKNPQEGVFEKTFLLNQSSLKETNINAYLSNRKNKTGFTLFSGYNNQKPVDVNKDGFSDVPDNKSFFIHSTLFIYPDIKNIIYIGYNGVFENRKGGDMQVLKNHVDNLHQYFVRNNSGRNTIDGNWENKINQKDRFELKGTASWFNRKIETNVFGMDASQLSYFTEANYLKRWDKNDLVAGINLTGEHFNKKLPDSTLFKEYDQTTVGLFIQDDWRTGKKITVQTGLRWDHHNAYGSFVLPRIFLLYKINSDFTSRFGGGLGYEIPTVFDSDIDERDYPKILPLNTPVSVRAERSQGANLDVNYHHFANNWDITVNQTFYINNIQDPIITDTVSTGQIYFHNAYRPVTSYGFESYIQVLHDKLELYAGYTFTVAKKLYDAIYPNLDLIARNKFASIVAYEFTDDFRAGIESAYTGKQYLENGNRTPGFLFVAAMVRYDYKQLSFALNCENLFDYRQTSKENIVIPPYSNPRFKQLWAPIDGRVINLSVRVKL